MTEKLYSNSFEELWITTIDNEIIIKECEGELIIYSIQRATMVCMCII